MTDDEILKSVAEIEGITKHPDQHTYWVDSKEWNPLKDAADLLPLIEKYKPHIEFNQPNGKWVCTVEHSYKLHESLPHAVLMAIIEAHK